MFKSTQWILEEPGADITRYDVMAPLVVKPVTRDTFLGTHGFDFAETGFEVLRIQLKLVANIFQTVPLSSLCTDSIRSGYCPPISF